MQGYSPIKLFIVDDGSFDGIEIKCSLSDCAQLGMIKGLFGLDSSLSKINVNDENIEPLTDREKEVLRLVVKGYSNPQIAEKLVISRHTAKAHLSNIFEKLNVTDRTQAAVKACKYNLC